MNITLVLPFSKITNTIHTNSERYRERFAEQEKPFCKLIINKKKMLTFPDFAFWEIKPIHISV
jgi:hypothetical protein